MNFQKTILFTQMNINKDSNLSNNCHKVICASALTLAFLFTPTSFAESYCDENPDSCVDLGNIDANPPSTIDPYWGTTYHASPHPWSAGVYDTTDDYGEDDGYDTCILTSNSIKSNKRDNNDYIKISDNCVKKQKYCDMKLALEGLIQGLIAGNKITGTASNGYTIGEVSAGIHRDILLAAYKDIDYYYNSGGTTKLPFSYTNGIIDFYRVQWDLTGYDEYGADHVFANWVKSLGQGDGTSHMIDPDPGIVCPS